MTTIPARLYKFFLLFAATLGFYSLARLEFLLWNWPSFNQRALSELVWAFVVGLRFDLSAISYMALPIFLILILPWPSVISTKTRQKFLWVSFSILQIPILILSLVDTAFIEFVGRRFTADTLFIFQEAEGKLGAFAKTYWQLFLVNTIFVVVMGWVFSCISLKQEPLFLAEQSLMDAKKRALNAVVLSLTCLILLVVASRGGLQNKPIDFVHANVFDVPLLNNLVLNSTFTVLKSTQQAKLAKVSFFENQSNWRQFLNGGQQIPSLAEQVRMKTPTNVVIIMLEGFSTEYTGRDLVDSHTPFLDSLVKQSLYFPRAMANGRRSIEGVAAVMAGIPALMTEPFISSQFASNYFLGLGTLLAQKNYDTAFFHGGNNGTMYFDTFMKSAGVAKYYGANEYPNHQDHDGVWGIWDEPFLQWSVQQISQLKTPFMASIFTLSSHHPFQIPEKYKADFPERELPILKTIRYADFALKKFFESATKQSWYANTLFVITADHTSLHYRAEYKNDLGNYEVPILFYHPQIKNWPKLDIMQPVGQIDILPSIMDFLNFEMPMKNDLGRSVFQDGPRVAVQYMDGRYMIVSDKDWMLWSPEQGSALNRDPQVFALEDRTGSHPLNNSHRRDELLNQLKAHIQYFSEGMWDNRLYYR